MADGQLLIESSSLSLLKGKMREIADLILSYIDAGAPILIKHHNDCDGYCAGMALEKAIVPLYLRKSRETPLYKVFKRIATRTPFYDYSDALRDISNFVSPSQRVSSLPPLIIVTDHGSTGESVFSYRTLKLAGAKIVVIDHHNPRIDGKGMPEIGKYTDHFLNPHLVGLDSNITAGMLCTEVARLVNGHIKSINFIPALSGVADKSRGEVFESYLSISGYSREFLERWALAIDFLAFYFRSGEVTSMLRQIFDEAEERDELIMMISSEVQERLDEMDPALQRYSSARKIGQVTFTEIELEKIATRFEFPTSSKITSRLHKAEEAPKITIGLMQDSVTFRVDGVEKFRLHDLIGILTTHFPHALIDGGGHDFAGTIRFAPGARDEVVNEIRKYIESASS